MKRITVFCGSNSGSNPLFKTQAIDLGKELATRKMELVYGGGKTGLMGAVADGALDNGGKVTGVLPGFMKIKELEHEGVTEIITVDTMHQRKSIMYSLGDAIIVLPGGFGTMDEMFEALTWAQLALHCKPVALLNTAGYYNNLLKFIDTMIDNSFLKEEYRNLFIVESEIDKLFDKITNFVPIDNEKWFELKVK
ncbi:TIGR00730 family Rossman fold protein [Dysgonomonas sp. 216]|uniref:LOG family protein n=1 Tax=Dysgonomonas sp. 216 TaxID=2302934 RepID=UPI0013D32891|nr:TIGR00730 family Rossman fold protein [Dysgonomonas sp. 216]NDW19549.1 TIGR00730 family Rossman fold protein [Dysgonomonas sp. 216]